MTFHFGTANDLDAPNNTLHKRSLYLVINVGMDDITALGSGFNFAGFSHPTNSTTHPPSTDVLPSARPPI